MCGSTRRRRANLNVQFSSLASTKSVNNQSTVNSNCATGRRLIRSIIRDRKYSNLLQTLGDNLSGTHFEIRCHHPSRNTSTRLPREENGSPSQQETGERAAGEQAAALNAWFLLATVTVTLFLTSGGEGGEEGVEEGAFINKMLNLAQISRGNSLYK